MSARTVAKGTAIAVAVAGGMLLLYRLITQVADVLVLLVISAFLAVALGPAVALVERRRIPRSAAILLIYGAILLLLVGVGLLIVPPVVTQVDAFVREVPRYVSDLRASPVLAEYDNRYGVTEALMRQTENLPQRLGDAVGALRSVTVGVFAAVFQLLTILVITFFLLLDGRRITDRFFAQLGPEREPSARRVAGQVYRAVGGYVAGAFSLALIAGVSSYVVLKLLRVPFAEALAVLVLFLDLIPLVGASIAGGLIAVVAAVSNFPTALIIWAVFFLVYQQIENNILQPLVYKRTVELSPLFVIVAVLLGGSLLGVLGALLAIPVAAALQILGRNYYPQGPLAGGETPPSAPPPPAPQVGPPGTPPPPDPGPRPQPS